MKSEDLWTSSSSHGLSVGDSIMFLTDNGNGYLFDNGKQSEMANVDGHTRKYVSFEEDVEERLQRLERKMAS